MATEKPRDLIDRNQLFNHLADYWGIPRDWDGGVDKTCEDALGAIEDTPTVDAVEVVRCRDCKHYMTIHCTCDGCCISDDWYCADGERRTDP